MKISRNSKKAFIKSCALICIMCISHFYDVYKYIVKFSSTYQKFRALENASHFQNGEKHAQKRQSLWWKLHHSNQHIKKLHRRGFKVFKRFQHLKNGKTYFSSKRREQWILILFRNCSPPRGIFLSGVWESRWIRDKLLAPFPKNDFLYLCVGSRRVRKQ